MQVNTQHGLQGKRRPAVPAFRVVRCNEANQLGPGNHLLHLFEELALAGFLATKLEVQGGLFHGLNFLRPGLNQTHG